LIFLFTFLNISRGRKNLNFFIGEIKNFIFNFFVVTAGSDETENEVPQGATCEAGPATQRAHLR
jgi:hypothetical protein